MKQLLIVGLLSLGIVSCNETTEENLDQPMDQTMEQEVTPGAELGSEPMVAPDASMMTGSSTEHFDAALSSLDQSEPALAADHMQMAISALETESVDLQGDTRTEIDTVIEQLEDLTDRLRTGEATDRSEIEQLVTRAETLVSDNQ